MSSFHNTIATLARCKKPLSHFAEFVELKKQVNGLQKSDEHRGALERENKDSIDHLTNQVHALSEAFRVLSGVLVEEVDGLKKELRSQKRDLKAVAKAHASQMQWTTSVQREMSDLRASLEKDAAEEAIVAMKRAARQDARLDGLAAKVEEAETEVERVRAATADARTQRADDLELTQAALEAAQRNQRRLDAECKALAARAQKAEAGCPGSGSTAQRWGEASRLTIFTPLHSVASHFIPLLSSTPSSRGCGFMQSCASP